MCSVLKLFDLTVEGNYSTFSVASILDMNHWCFNVILITETQSIE